VIAAYCVFVVVLLWDFVAPRLQLRQQMRAAQLRVARNASRTTSVELN
jgi:heme exporter protein D